MHSDSTPSMPRASRALRGLRGGAFAVATLLVAGTAHASTAELTDLTLRGVLAYFSDPENVRGVLGAGLGAIISVVVAQTVFGASAEDSDD